MLLQRWIAWYFKMLSSFRCCNFTLKTSIEHGDCLFLSALVTVICRSVADAPIVRNAASSRNHDDILYEEQRFHCNTNLVEDLTNLRIK